MKKVSEEILKRFKPICLVDSGDAAGIVCAKCGGILLDRFCPDTIYYEINEFVLTAIDKHKCEE